MKIERICISCGEIFYVNNSQDRKNLCDKCNDEIWIHFCPEDLMDDFDYD